MPTDPPKKRTPAKSTAKKKTSATRKRTASKKSTSKAATSSASAPTPKKKRETLHNVARSIGATLGTLAKTTSDAVKAAKQVLPNLKHSE